MHAVKDVVAALGVTVGILAGLAAGADAARAQGKAVASAWWEEMEALDGDLRDGNWKKVAKRAPKLAREITEHSWYHPELRLLFAEVSLYEAIAAANLGRDTHAIWMWHIAQNLERSTLERDLSGYGNAGKLLYEYPLRAEGELPYRFRDAPQGPISGASFSRPKLDDSGDRPVVLSSTAVAVDRRSTLRPVQVEVIFDREGHPNEPVIIFPPDIHPAVAWSVLRFVPQRKAEPARLDGKTIPYMLEIEFSFDVIRGSSRGPNFTAAK